MTNDPFQILLLMLTTVAFPFIIWMPGRITQLTAAGQDERIPNILKSWANMKYVEAVRRGEKKPVENYRFNLLVAAFGLPFPCLIICSASYKDLMPRLVFVLASFFLFFIGVALFEWVIQPRNQ